jgi:acetoin utilization protein AcuB
MANPTIGDYMTAMPHTIGSDQSMAKASELMKELGIRHLPVLRGGKLLGVVSDRDVKIVESFHDVNPDEVTVDEGLYHEAYSVAADTPLAEVAREMYKHKYGSAVVMEGTQVVGIFTTVDGMRALAEALNKIS